MITFVRSVMERRAADERGVASFIWFIMFLPLMLGLFGVAVDFAASTYSAATLQSALDTATQSAIAQSANPTNGQYTVLSANTAQNTVRQYYSLNRRKVPFLACQGNGAPHHSGLIITSQPCPWVETGFTFQAGNKSGRNYLSYSVTEYTHYLFLEFVGLDYQEYDLNSIARLNQSVQG